MRILIYNWARLDETNTCGGVSVYTRNLVSGLLVSGNYEIYFLNSGLTYTIDGHLSINPSENVFGEKVKSYEIFNSPVIAPVQQSIKNTEYYLTDKTLYVLIKNWMQLIGGFDIIHFQNLEGLSLKVLDLKKDYPNTKFIYSLHNYFPLCTAVNLWNINKSCDCSDFNRCKTCFYRRRYFSTKLTRIFNHSRLIEGITWHLSNHFPDKGDATLYRLFFERNRQMINENIDILLSVSERVRDIFIQKGYNSNKITTSYIGTKVADNQLMRNTSDVQNSPFNIIYMGYMLNFKGYYFFIDALKKMPLDISKNIHVTICAGHSWRFNHKEISVLRKLKRRFFDITLINGYTPATQSQYLKNQHLGIVPVLWEDNLPQVLIEQIAYGVPVLCSDLGGGKEIVNNPIFTFKAGNIDDFIKKFVNIYSDRNKLQNFWLSVKKLTTLEEHTKFLNKIYNC